MRKIHLIFVFSAVLALSLLFSAGCFKKKEAPDPPTVRSRLVQETFNSLEKGDHQSAVKKIERLRKLDAGNIFLANLETTEKSNSKVSEIQLLVNEGRIDEAIKMTDEHMFKEGRSDEFLAILNELQTLKQLKEAVEAVNDSSNVTRLARNAAKIKMIAAKYKPAQVLLPLANEKLALAKKLYSSEKRKAVDDLSIEAFALLSKNDSRAVSALSVLGLENPEHPVILDYLDYISGSVPKPVVEADKSKGTSKSIK
ncbi:MAG TPA: hypothetical protein DCZ94_13100 [Lentisphaeria bacterium]|nr:MAG: hypothetical protein A2X48_06230 [Lentisphaerae bacterium GWF2_49_21]HBC87886.1 hypothetical protein [Lentisphaeria bacterium]